MTGAHVGCQLQTQTKDKLNSLALIGVITLSTTFPLAHPMQKLCVAIEVGGRCTLANSSIGDTPRVDHTYTTWPQPHHILTDFIKEDLIVAIPLYLAATYEQFYNSNTYVWKIFARRKK